MKALEIVQERFPNVVSVRDAKRSISIEVTKRDCNSRAVKNHQECAMAAAVKREKHLTGVMISLKSAYLIKGNKALRYSVPQSVSREVTSFDRNAPFEPGEYRLVKPAPATRLGARAERKRISDNGHQYTGKGVAKRFLHKTQNVRTKLGSKEWKASSI